MITPNVLTLLRLVIALVCPFLLVWSRTFISDFAVMLLFIAACITDWWDGHLARTRSLITPAGKILDPIADKLLILGLMATFVYLKLYGIEWILAIVVRELAVTTARLVQLKKKEVIPAEWAGKLKLGFQIGSICASLLYLSLRDTGLYSHSSLILKFTYWLHWLGVVLANFFTIASGIKFFKRLN